MGKCNDCILYDECISKPCDNFRAVCHLNKSISKFTEQEFLEATEGI